MYVYEIYFLAEMCDTASRNHNNMLYNKFQYSAVSIITYLKRRERFAAMHNVTTSNVMKMSICKVADYVTHV